MTRAEKEKAFARLLVEVSKRPQVAYIPFMGTRERFYLLVNLLTDAEKNREQLVSECAAAARLVIGSGLLGDEAGVEVAVFGPGGGRLVRLSVLEAAFALVESASVDELIENRFVGIACSWPATKLSS